MRNPLKTISSPRGARSSIENTVTPVIEWPPIPCGMIFQVIKPAKEPRTRPITACLLLLLNPRYLTSLLPRFFLMDPFIEPETVQNQKRKNNEEDYEKAVVRSHIGKGRVEEGVIRN